MNVSLAVLLVRGNVLGYMANRSKPAWVMTIEWRTSNVIHGEKKKGGGLGRKAVGRTGRSCMGV